MYSTVLELAISMIFLYLMLSGACSAIQEIIANIFRWRATTLEKGIAGLLDEGFKEDLYKTPLISGLCSPNARGQLTRRPSYIPSATFALAVLQLAEEKGIHVPGTPVSSSATIVANPPASVAPQTAQLLQSLLLGTSSIEDQKKRLEDWFDGSMDRVSGWYKRKTHLVLWVISVILCIFVNADSISLANSFWNDPTLRTAMTTAATEKVKNSPKPPAQTPAPNNKVPGGVPAQTGTGVSPSRTSVPADDAFKRLDEVRKDLAKINVPLGWCHVTQGQPNAIVKCWPDFEKAQRSANVKDSSSISLDTSSNTNINNSGGEKDSSLNDPRLRLALNLKNWQWWLLKFLGIALTALAISQGAPFWFDLLQKAVNLRLAGDAPDEKKQSK